MKRKMNLRAIVGAAVSAATLLALAPLGAANAADVSLDMSQAGQTSITINVDTSNTSSGTMEGHKFAAVQIGNYENAEGDASTGVLSSVAVSTVSGIKADAASALSSAKGDLGLSPTTAAAGYDDNPVGEVAANWLGYSGTDSSSNNGSVPNGWKGNLRQFVTRLAGNADFAGKFTSSSPSTTVTSGNTATISGLTPGIYIVEDVTPSGASGLSATSHKNSIPMLVSTGIVIGTTSPTTYNKIGSQALGEINLKNDAPSVKKTLDTDGVTNNPSIGGTLHYKFTSKVPLTTGYSHYIFSMVDTPSQKGLTYDAVQSVTSGGTTLSASRYNVNEVKYTGSTSTKYLDIDLTPSIRNLTYGDQIVVKFTMKVNDDATGGALENGVTLAYSTDTNNQPTQDKGEINPNTGQITSCTVGPSDPNCHNGTVVNDNTPGSSNPDSTSYFRHFNVWKEKKVGGAGLAGATFTLTPQSGSDAIKFLQVGNGSYKKAADPTESGATDQLAVYDSSSSVAADSAAGAPSSNGQLKIDGLAPGVYTLAESTPPTGYSTTFKPSVEVTVGQGSSAAVSGFANKGDTWGLVAKNGTYNAGGTATALNDVSWNVSGTNAAPGAGAIVVDNVNSVSQLPLTGGAGAILALLVVVVLGLLTATLIFVRRRLNTDSNANMNVAAKA